MKVLILSIIIVLFTSGCADKRLILIPQSEYYPTFPTQDFEHKDMFVLDVWPESEEVNGTTVNYLVAEQKHLLDYIKDNKDTRSKYNLLLKKLNEFNSKILEMNKIQNDKKPTEINDITESWFKN